MKLLLRYVAWVDRLNDRVGQFLCWLVLATVLIGAYNSLARYAGKFLKVHLTSNALVELQWYMFSAVFLLGAGYLLRHNAHVRVDVFYERLSVRGRARLNFIGAIVLLIPFSLFLFWVCWPAVLNSWKVYEMSPDPGGLPRYPIKALLPAGFLLLFLQGIAEAIRNWAILRGSELVSEEEYRDVG